MRYPGPLRILIACEHTGAVRDAFRARGFHAVSCDLLPTVAPGPHIQGDALKFLHEGWDAMIAHPPCTHLAVSGARWFPQKRADGRQQAALKFVRQLMDAPIPHIAIENPISVISSQIRKPEQIIQPHQFGHREFKATCLWLKNLPQLTPTEPLAPPEKGTDEHKAWSRVHRLPPSPDRWQLRSTTYTGIAEAMALQWGDHIINMRSTS